MEVPFGCGERFPVSQAHNVGSHQHSDVWAWDFRMPEGTPVTAARDGVVRLARGDSQTGGCDESFAFDANYVVLSHPGGYETQYLHFSQVVVKPGDQVKAGDLLGYSGATGWACGAHLHFKVTRNSGSSWNNESIPARFVRYGDPQVDTVLAARACPARPNPLQMQMAKAQPAPAEKSSKALVVAPAAVTAPRR